MTELRPARAFDAPACAAILNGWIDETPWVPRLGPPAEVAAFFREFLAPHAVTVAERGGEVAGFLALDRPRGMVAALYVTQGVRGAGIGSALLRAAQAGTARLTLWAFQANVGARRFYARHGFVEGRRTAGDNPEGLPDVELTWEAPG